VSTRLATCAVVPYDKYNPIYNSVELRATGNPCGNVHCLSREDKYDIITYIYIYIYNYHHAAAAFVCVIERAKQTTCRRQNKVTRHRRRRLPSNLTPAIGIKIGCADDMIAPRSRYHLISRDTELFWISNTLVLQ